MEDKDWVEIPVPQTDEFSQAAEGMQGRAEDSTTEAQLEAAAITAAGSRKFTEILHDLWQKVKQNHLYLWLGIAGLILLFFIISAFYYGGKAIISTIIESKDEISVENKVSSPNVTVNNQVTFDAKAAEALLESAKAQTEYTQFMREVYADPGKISRESKKAELLFSNRISTDEVYDMPENIDPLYRLTPTRETPQAIPLKDDGLYQVNQRVYLDVRSPSGKTTPPEFDRQVNCLVDVNEESVTDCNIPFSVDFGPYLRPEPPKPRLVGYVPIWS